MECITLSADFIDNASDEEINRLLICMNDGQGDHCVHTIHDILGFYKEDPSLDGIDVSNIKRSRILEAFLKGFDANSLDTVLFREHVLGAGKYFKVRWWWQNET